MKASSVLTLILTLCCLLETTKADCLSPEFLKTLGLIPLPERKANDSIQPDTVGPYKVGEEFFKDNGGSCVEQDSLEANWTKKKEESTRDAFKTYAASQENLKSMPAQIEDFGTALVKLGTEVTKKKVGCADGLKKIGQLLKRLKEHPKSLEYSMYFSFEDFMTMIKSTVETDGSIGGRDDRDPEWLTKRNNLDPRYKKQDSVLTEEDMERVESITDEMALAEFTSKVSSYTEEERSIVTMICIEMLKTTRQALFVNKENEKKDTRKSFEGFGGKIPGRPSKPSSGSTNATQGGTAPSGERPDGLLTGETRPEGPPSSGSTSPGLNGDETRPEKPEGSDDDSSDTSEGNTSAENEKTAEELNEAIQKSIELKEKVNKITTVIDLLEAEVKKKALADMKEEIKNGIQTATLEDHFDFLNTSIFKVKASQLTVEYALLKEKFDLNYVEKGKVSDLFTVVMGILELVMKMVDEKKKYDLDSDVVLNLAEWLTELEVFAPPSTASRILVEASTGTPESLTYHELLKKAKDAFEAEYTKFKTAVEAFAAAIDPVMEAAKEYITAWAVLQKTEPEKAVSLLKLEDKKTLFASTETFIKAELDKITVQLDDVNVSATDKLALFDERSNLNHLTSMLTKVDEFLTGQPEMIDLFTDVDKMKELQEGDVKRYYIEQITSSKMMTLFIEELAVKVDGFGAEAEALIESNLLIAKLKELLEEVELLEKATTDDEARKQCSEASFEVFSGTLMQYVAGNATEKLATNAEGWPTEIFMTEASADNMIKSCLGIQFTTCMSFSYSYLLASTDGDVQYDRNFKRNAKLCLDLAPIFVCYSDYEKCSAETKQLLLKVHLPFKGCINNKNINTTQQDAALVNLEAQANSVSKLTFASVDDVVSDEAKLIPEGSGGVRTENGKARPFVSNETKRNEDEKKIKELIAAVGEDFVDKNTPAGFKPEAFGTKPTGGTRPEKPTDGTGERPERPDKPTDGTGERPEKPTDGTGGRPSGGPRGTRPTRRVLESGGNVEATYTIDNSKGLDLTAISKISGLDTSDIEDSLSGLAELASATQNTVVNTLATTGSNILGLASIIILSLLTLIE